MKDLHSLISSDKKNMYQYYDLWLEKPEKSGNSKMVREMLGKSVHGPRLLQHEKLY